MKKNILVESTKSKFQVLAQKPANVLKRIKGVLSDFGTNRNGRIYPRELWENVINSDYVQEMINSHGLVGELDHPEERLEISLQEVSHVINDMWIEGDQVIGIIDILPTPNGKIVNELLDYGTDIGISSRGAGSVGEGNIVDPDYQFITFDFVARPSCEAARLNTILEGVKVDLANNSAEKVSKILEGYKSSLKESSEDYIVSMEVSGYYFTKVNANSKEEAKEKAESNVENANFGELKSVKWNISHVRDNNDNILEGADLDNYTEEDFARSTARWRELEKLSVKSSGLVVRWCGSTLSDDDTIDYCVEDRKGNRLSDDSNLQNKLSFNVGDLGKMSDEEFKDLKLNIEMHLRLAISNLKVGVSRECPMCGKEYIMYVDSSNYKSYAVDGNMLQDAFKDLNPMEREFVKSGYCPECQSKIFGTDYTSDRIITIDEARKMTESIKIIKETYKLDPAYKLNEAMSDQEVYKVVLNWYKEQIEAGKMTLNQCYELLSDKAKVSLNKLVDQSKIRESVMDKEIKKLIKESKELPKDVNEWKYNNKDSMLGDLDYMNDKLNDAKAKVKELEATLKKDIPGISRDKIEAELKSAKEKVKSIEGKIKHLKGLKESYQDTIKYRMNNDDDLIVIRKNGEVIDKGMVDDIKDNWDRFEDFRFDELRRCYVLKDGDDEYTVEKIIVEAYGEEPNDQKYHPILNKDLEISSPLELNTGVLPVLDVGTYGREEYIFDWERYRDEENPDEEEPEEDWDELDRNIVHFGTPIVEEYIKRVLPSAKVEGLKVYHPQYYNFSNDELEFKVSFDIGEYNDLETKTFNNPEFKNFLRENYKSYDGFFSYLADNLDEFYQQDGWKRFVQVIMFNLRDIDEDEFNDTTDRFWEDIIGNGYYFKD